MLVLELESPTIEELLPSWVRWFTPVCFGALTFLLSAISSALGARVAGGPLRRTAPDAHWTVFARNAATAQGGALYAFVLTIAPLGGLAAICAGVPGALTTGQMFLVLLVSSWLGQLAWQRRFRRALPLHESDRELRFRSAATHVAVFWSGWLALVTAAAFMPRHPGPLAWTLWAICALNFVLSLFGVGLQMTTVPGLVREADERVRELVQGIAVTMNVHVRSVHVADLGVCNAYAYPFTRVLLFTESVLETLDDDELAAIVRHELGHLQESTGTKLQRILPFFMLVPLSLWNPLLYSMEPYMLTLGLLAYVLLARGSQTRGRKAETSADQVATEHSDGAVYARALERIHRRNLSPAVGHRRSTHPDLYDRIVATGIEPDYARPKPPGKWLARLGGVSSLLVTIPVMSALYFVIQAPPPQGERAQLLALAVGPANAHELAAWSRTLTERGDHEAALPFARRAYQRAGWSIEIQTQLVLTLALCHECDEAREEYAGLKRDIGGMPLSLDQRRQLEAAEAAMAFCGPEEH